MDFDSKAMKQLVKILKDFSVQYIVCLITLHSFNDLTHCYHLGRSIAIHTVQLYNGTCVHWYMHITGLLNLHR